MGSDCVKWPGARNAALALLLLALGAVAAPAADESTSDDEAVQRHVEAEVSERMAGIEAYRDDEPEEARAKLEAARRSDPADPALPLFLGLVYLRMDDPAKAASAWSDFARIAPDDSLADEVRRHVTLLRREVHRRAAAQAIAQEAKSGAEVVTLDSRTVAVTPFAHQGAVENEPLATAMAAMLVANLSTVPELRVVERDRVEVLLAEAELGDADLVETSTAVRVGRLLPAGRMVTGTTRDWTASPTHLGIDVSLFDVSNGRSLGSYGAEGLLTEFYELVPRIGQQLATGLTVAAAAGLLTTHTQNLQAAMEFGTALEKKKVGDYSGARESLEKALELDPQFELARQELALLPVAAISIAAIAKAVEGSAYGFAGAGSGLGAGTTTALVAGGLVAAGTGIGIGVSGVASGDGGGGDGPGSGGQTVAPLLSGVASGQARTGVPVTFDVVGSDPDDTVVTLSGDFSQTPGATFEQQPGNPATGRYRWVPQSDFESGTRRVVFTATDSGVPPQTTTVEIDLSVTQVATPGPSVAPTDVGVPTATPTPTPTPTATTMPLATGTIAVPTAAPSGTPQDTPTRTPTQTPTLTSTATPTPTFTPTLTPTFEPIDCEPIGSSCFGGACCPGLVCDENELCASPP